MLDALITGKLIKECQLKTSQNGNSYTNFLLTVGIGELENIVVSGIAFGDAAERIAKLAKGDALSVAGSLKPNEWTDKATGEIKRGLSVTANQVLSVHDIKKKRKAAEPAKQPAPANSGRPLNDEVDF